jgi:hypothetical protein
MFSVIAATSAGGLPTHERFLNPMNGLEKARLRGKLAPCAASPQARSYLDVQGLRANDVVDWFQALMAPSPGPMPSGGVYPALRAERRDQAGSPIRSAPRDNDVKPLR